MIYSDEHMANNTLLHDVDFNIMHLLMALYADVLDLIVSQFG